MMLVPLFDSFHIFIRPRIYVKYRSDFLFVFQNKFITPGQANEVASVPSPTFIIFRDSKGNRRQFPGFFYAGTLAGGKLARDDEFIFGVPQHLEMKRKIIDQRPIPHDERSIFLDRVFLLANETHLGPSGRH